MSSTKQQVVNKFKIKYGEAGETLAEQLFDDAHRIICQKIQCRNSTVTVNVTSGVQEYNYDATGSIVAIHEAYYVTAAGILGRTTLNKVSRDELAALQSNWLGELDVQTPGPPTQFYIYSAPANSNNTGGQGTLGLIPPPNATTATYPYVLLYVTTNVQLALSDAVPVQLQNDYVYLYLMYEMYCEQRRPADLAQYVVDASKGIRQSDIEIEKNIAFVALGTPAAPATANIYRPGVHTKRTVVAQFLQIYPECDPNLAYQLFDEQNSQVATRIQLRNSEQYVNLVSNQAEYLYDPNGLITMVHSAYLWLTADPASAIQLLKTSTDKLNQTYYNWRSQPAGQPVWFYVDGAVANSNSTGGQGAIGFYPKPFMSTAAGAPQQYPAVLLEVATRALMGLDDALPVQLLDDNLYIYGMCERYAKKFKPGDLARWTNPTNGMRLSEEEFEKNLSLVKNVIDDTYTQFQPGFFLNMGGGAR